MTIFSGFTTSRTLVRRASVLDPMRHVIAGYRDGPYSFPPRPFSWGLVATVARERRWRLATGGYLGHMFELYAFWTWIPAFLAASVAVVCGLIFRRTVAR